MIQIIFLAVLSLVAFVVTTNPGSLDRFLNFFSAGSILGTPIAPASNKVTIGDAVLTVEVVDTPEKRSKGLGGRDSLGENEGMLFIFSKPDQYKFWMKSMKIPIDIIWIKGDVVVDLLANVLPPSVGQDDSSLPLYSASSPVDRVVEVKAGYIDAHNIKIGDKVRFE